MRTRNEIKLDDASFTATFAGSTDKHTKLSLEVLLDIRDLLEKLSTIGKKLS